MFERLFSSLCVQIDLEGQGSISKQGDQLGGLRILRCLTLALATWLSKNRQGHL